MYRSWIVFVVIYIPVISAKSNVSLATRCQHLGEYSALLGKVCYARIYDEKSWESSRKDCAEDGGKLAKVTGRPLMDELFGNKVSNTVFAKSLFALNAFGLLSSLQEKYWIGARVDGHGRFLWLDGSELAPEFWQTTTQLVSTIKNLFFKRDLCVIVRKGGWEQEECSKKHSYICEHDLSAFENLTEARTTDSLETVTSPEKDTEAPNKQLKTTTAIKNEYFSTFENLTEAQTTDLLETVTSPAKDIHTANKPLETTKHELAKANPARLPQNIFVGVKHVSGLFNPRLKATADVIVQIFGMMDCLRVCYYNPRCGLVNFYPPDHCAMYFDPVTALSLGAESARRWSVWRNMAVKAEL